MFAFRNRQRALVTVLLYALFTHGIAAEPDASSVEAAATTRHPLAGRPGLGSGYPS